VYVGHLLHGNLGYSYKLNEPVRSLLWMDLPKSAYLTGVALFFTVMIAVPLGIYQAVCRNHPGDYAFTSLAFVGYSMPTFWLGLLLIAFFSVYLKWLPPAAPGMGGGAARSIFVHVIPNAIGTIVVNITVQVADAILALAALCTWALEFHRPPRTGARCFPKE
jgi:ABC-type dipeptide/oligopeptide/nickel transport system permease component